MISEHGFTFQSDELSRLAPGNVSIRVPVHKNAIQINTDWRNTTSERLVIATTDSTVAFYREDGESVQIEKTVENNLRIQRRIQILSRVVEDLVFIRGQEKDTWTTAEPVDSINEQEYFFDFVDMVAMYAKAREGRPTR